MNPDCRLLIANEQISFDKPKTEKHNLVNAVKFMQATLNTISEELATINCITPKDVLENIDAYISMDDTLCNAAKDGYDLTERIIINFNYHKSMEKYFEKTLRYAVQFVEFSVPIDSVMEEIRLADAITKVPNYQSMLENIRIGLDSIKNFMKDTYNIAVFTDRSTTGVRTKPAFRL